MFRLKPNPERRTCKNKIELLIDICTSKGGIVISDEFNCYGMVFTCDKGHTWKTRPINITYGFWCPKCKYINHRPKFTDKGKETMRRVTEERKLKLTGKTLEEIHGVTNAKSIREKLSIAVRKRIVNGKRQDLTEEGRKRQSLFMKNRVISQETRDKCSRYRMGKATRFGPHSETTKAKIREKRATQITPIEDTKIEKKMQSILTELGLLIQPHKYMKIKHAYRCDIFVPCLNLVIECDGDYWHGHPKKYPVLNEHQKAQQERDMLRTEELKAAGFDVLRLWEHDINRIQIREEMQ